MAYFLSDSLPQIFSRIGPDLLFSGAYVVAP